MENFQRSPLKLYIQDIFRAKRSDHNKYIYEMFGLTFKNIMIHGVVTAVYNTLKTSLNFELSDATGSVHVYYDCTKNNHNITNATINYLYRDFVEASRFGDINIQIMNKLMDRITNKRKHEIVVGEHLVVVGDIFIDETRDVRMVSGYECSETSVDRDIVWMEELRYLYDNYYIRKKN